MVGLGVFGSKISFPRARPGGVSLGLPLIDGGDESGATRILCLGPGTNALTSSSSKLRVRRSPQRKSSKEGRLMNHTYSPARMCQGRMENRKKQANNRLTYRGWGVYVWNRPTRLTRAAIAFLSGCDKRDRCGLL